MELPKTLILNPVLFAGGNGSIDILDDGRTITVTTGLRGEVRAGVVPSSRFLIRRNSGACLFETGRRKVVDLYGAK